MKARRQCDSRQNGAQILGTIGQSGARRRQSHGKADQQQSPAQHRLILGAFMMGNAIVAAAAIERKRKRPRQEFYGRQEFLRAMMLPALSPVITAESTTPKS
jgi:hypothetical protein